MEKIKINTINKIKINNDGTATINYVIQGNLASSEVTYSGKEKVTEEFYKKFQETVETFIGIITRLKPDEENIEMNVIQFGYSNDDVLKNVVYSAKYLFHDASNAIMDLKTPKIPVRESSFDDDTYHITGSDKELLHRIIELAKKYINGETGTLQGKLNLVVDNEE